MYQTQRQCGADNSRPPSDCEGVTCSSLHTLRDPSPPALRSAPLPQEIMNIHPEMPLQLNQQLLWENVRPSDSNCCCPIAGHEIAVHSLQMEMNMVRNGKMTTWRLPTFWTGDKSSNICKTPPIQKITISLPFPTLFSNLIFSLTCVCLGVSINHAKRTHLGSLDIL